MGETVCAAVALAADLEVVAVAARQAFYPLGAGSDLAARADPAGRIVRRSVLHFELHEPHVRRRKVPAHQDAGLRRSVGKDVCEFRWCGRRARPGGTMHHIRPRAPRGTVLYAIALALRPKVVAAAARKPFPPEFPARGLLAYRYCRTRPRGWTGSARLSALRIEFLHAGNRVVPVPQAQLDTICLRIVRNEPQLGRWITWTSDGTGAVGLRAGATAR